MFFFVVRFYSFVTFLANRPTRLFLLAFHRLFELMKNEVHFWLLIYYQNFAGNVPFKINDSF